MDILILRYQLKLNIKWGIIAAVWQGLSWEVDNTNFFLTKLTNYMLRTGQNSTNQIGREGILIFRIYEDPHQMMIYLKRKECKLRLKWMN